MSKRAGEGVVKVLMKLFTPLMRGPLRKYRAIHAETIAKGMLNAAPAAAAWSADLRIRRN